MVPVPVGTTKENIRRRWNGYRNKSLTHKVNITIIITRVWNGYLNKS